MNIKGNQIAIPAIFMRGGTSRALIFKEWDLPEDQTLRHAIFLSAMGSPDPYGRQLDGMGGGISSLSKVCAVGPSSHPDADISYAQDGSLSVNKATVWRTARRLMDGHVYVPQQVQEVGS